MYKNTQNWYLSVDDMIAKSNFKEERLVNLRKLFEKLRKFKLRLNPTKCTFAVRSEKLLGFVMNQKGIEVDPYKVRAILEKPHHSIEKRSLGFSGKVKLHC